MLIMAHFAHLCNKDISSLSTVELFKQFLSTNQPAKHIFYRIFFGVISFSNRDKLISFYKRLINKGDFDKVMGYIEKYHEKKVYDYHIVFEKNQHLEDVEYEKADEHTKWQLMRGDVEYKNNASYSRQEKLAGSVYHSIIERDDFIKATATEFLTC